jgi:hypothetical protein
MRHIPLFSNVDSTFFPPMAGDKHVVRKLHKPWMAATSVSALVLLPRIQIFAQLPFKEIGSPRISTLTSCNEKWWSSEKKQGMCNVPAL